MKRYIFILTGCLWLATSCSDFLELNESQYHTVEYQFSTFGDVKKWRRMCMDMFKMGWLTWKTL